ncbi:YjjG family noncanonical pyrimidine nucleotidase [Myroides sp. LJL119]
MSKTGFVDKTDIFFDLDHTLWDFEKNSALAFDKVLKEYHMPFEIEDFLNFYVDINATYWDKYSLNLISREELRIGRISDTLKCLSHNVSNKEILEIADKYLDYLPQNNYLLDGAIDLLQYLETKGYNMHIITNGFNKVQHEKLRNSNIVDFFQTITDSEIAGVKKPDVEIFNFALTSAKTLAKNSIMIGDNLLADVQGAQKAGIDAIFYNELNKQTSLEILQVNRLIDIKKYL